MNPLRVAVDITRDMAAFVVLLASEPLPEPWAYLGLRVGAALSTYRSRDFCRRQVDAHVARVAAESAPATHRGGEYRAPEPA